MKTILLPTNFSPHSEQAMQFAINIAKLSNAKIIVSHCFFVPNLDINTPVDILEELYVQNKKDADQLLTQCCQNIALHKNNEGVPIPTTFISEQNLPYSHVRKIVEEHTVDLIVMGIETKKHLFELLGSTALHVANTSTCPVLLVHDKSQYKYFNKVFFAIENVKEDIQKLKKIIPFTRLYDSEISLLHIDPLPKDEDALEAMLYQKQQYECLLNQIVQEYKHSPNIHFHYNISDETFKKMDQVLKTEEPDLLVLVHKDRSLLESIFHKSTIKQILINNSIPLLIIH